MKLTISFTNIEHTPSLDERIQKKSEKFSKFFDQETSMKWTCFVKEGDHVAEVAIRGRSFNYIAKGKSSDLYKTLDIVVNRLEKQIHKHQGKVKDKLHRKRDEAVFLDPEVAWGDREDEVA